MLKYLSLVVLISVSMQVYSDGREDIVEVVNDYFDTHTCAPIPTPTQEPTPSPTPTPTLTPSPVPTISPTPTPVATATPTPTPTPTVQPTPEPTQTPSPDTGNDAGFIEYDKTNYNKKVYVSNSGVDNEDCTLENPCATIQKAIDVVRNIKSSHILLNRGDTWRVGFKALNDIPNGESKDKLSVLSYYGTGPRPVIEGTRQVYRQDRRKVENLMIDGIEFYAYAKDPDNAEFYDPTQQSGYDKDKFFTDHNYYKTLTFKGGPALRFVGEYENIIVQDCLFKFTGITVQQNTTVKRPKDFKIHRNIFDTSYSNFSSYTRAGAAASLFTYGTLGHFELTENVFDYGGWHPTVEGAGANMLSHCVYLQYGSNGDGVLVKGNIFSRCSSHGVQLRSGGLAEDNFFYKNTIGLAMGYSRFSVPDGVIAKAQNNVVLNGVGMKKGHEACYASNVCSSALSGITLEKNSNALFSINNNVVKDAIQPTNYRFTEYSIAVKPASAFSGNYLTGNIIHGWKSQREYQDSGITLPFPERSFKSYYEGLGYVSEDAYINTLKSRPLKTWNGDNSSYEINNYIRGN